jgi:hypothetical protein
MLIEYKIRFDEDGVTISQRIEPGDGPVDVRVDADRDDGSVTARELPASFAMTQASGSTADDSGHGGGPTNKAGVGGGPTDKAGVGGGPTDKAGVGGGPTNKSGVGGGEPGQVPVIIFGPIIVGAGKVRPKLRPDAPAE